MSTRPIDNSGKLDAVLERSTVNRAEGAKADTSEVADRKVPVGGYTVDLSEAGKIRAAERQKALAIANQTPDVREDRIASIKAQIAEGTYRPDPGKIADGMLREAIIDHLASDETDFT